MKMCQNLQVRVDVCQWLSLYIVLLVKNRGYGFITESCSASNFKIHCFSEESCRIYSQK